VLNMLIARGARFREPSLARDTCPSKTARVEGAVAHLQEIDMSRNRALRRDRIDRFNEALLVPRSRSPVAAACGPIV
jgi:hypothetical protein